MKKFTFALALALLSGLSIFAQAKTEAELKSLVKQMTDAQRNFDAAALDKVFTADYIEISPAGEFDPRAKVLGFYRPEAKPPAGSAPTSVTIGEYSIRRYDDFAVVIVRLDFETTISGKSFPRAMRATFVCRREKGAWKIASAQYTAIRPSPPPKPQ